MSCMTIPREIMSRFFTLCPLPSVKKQKHDFHFFHSKYDKTIIRCGFSDIQNNEGLGKDYHTVEIIVLLFGFG